MTHQAQVPGSGDLLDIVFENRNHAYGAYQLRRAYPYNLARAWGASILLVGALLGVAHLPAKFGDKTDTSEDGGIIIFCPPPSKIAESVQSKLPKMAATQPQKAVQRFVPILVTADEQAPEEGTTHTQTELIQTNTAIGATNQTGVVDGPPQLSDLELPGFGTGAASGDGNKTVHDLFDVQKPPSFPGGEQEMLKYLTKHVRYPDAARMAGISSRVVVSFVVNSDGSVSDIAVLQDPGGGCGREVVRVVSSMPYWIPGEANGQPVRVRFFLPVLFELK